jgi:hypothetical protein
LALFNAKLSHLSAVRLEQVDLDTLVQVRSLWKQASKLGSHLRTNFETAGSNTRASGNAKVL